MGQLGRLRDTPRHDPPFGHKLVRVLAPHVRVDVHRREWDVEYLRCIQSAAAKLQRRRTHLAGLHAYRGHRLAVRQAHGLC